MPNKILVVDKDNDQLRDNGCIAAILTRRSAQNAYKGKYMLSCLHVFGLLNMNIDNYRQNTNIRIGTAKLGEYKGEGGSFHTVNKKMWSFDAAIARIDKGQEQAVRDNIYSPKPLKCLSYIDHLPRTANVHTPRGPIKATNLDAKRGNQLEVTYGPNLGRVQAVHRLVVQYTANTLAGDSGSPVFSEHGNIFLGMHISGATDGTGFMLPAMDLIENANAFFEGLGDDTLALDL